MGDMIDILEEPRSYPIGYDLLKLSTDGIDLGEKIKQDKINEEILEKNNINYKKNNDNKISVLNNLGNLKSKEPISKLQTYEAIKIETEQLFKREKTLFIINSIVTVGLMVVTIRIIL